MCLAQGADLSQAFFPGLISGVEVGSAELFSQRLAEVSCRFCKGLPQAFAIVCLRDLQGGELTVEYLELVDLAP